MKLFKFFTLLFIFSLTACEEDPVFMDADPPVIGGSELPNAFINPYIELPTDVLFLGESYSVSTTMYYTDGLTDWKPNLSLWLSATTDCHVDPSPIGTHVYSGFYKPSHHTSTYIYAKTWATGDGPRTLTTTGSSQNLYINPFFWAEEADPAQPWIKPFGQYYILSIADTKRTLREEHEDEENVEARIVWVLPPPDQGETVQDLKNKYRGNTEVSNY